MLRFPVFLAFFAACAAAQDASPARGVNFYSLEREAELGRQLAAEFQRDWKPLGSPAVQAYIDRIGQSLAAQIGGVPFSYSFTVVAGDPTVLHEAVAFPGGPLFVPTSLILEARDEDEFAGMLAHAIAHIASRHFTRQATRAELLEVGSVSVPQLTGWSGYAMAQGRGLLIPLSLLSTWRGFELQADRLAAERMPAAGYDPAALIRYMERDRPSQPGTVARVFSVLPDREARVRAIQTVVVSLPPQTYSPHPDFAAMQDEVRRLLAER